MPKSRAKYGLVGAGLLALSTSIAAAAPAIVETDSNFRVGPGTNYRAVAVVQGGSIVDVVGCSGSWCSVAYGGRQGYIARSLLSMGGSTVVQAPPAIYGGYYAGPVYRSYPAYRGYYAYGPYAAWPAPSYPYYRDYYFQPGLSFGVGVGF